MYAIKWRLAVKNKVKFNLFKQLFTRGVVYFLLTRIEPWIILKGMCSTEFWFQEGQ